VSGFEWSEKNRFMLGEGDLKSRQHAPLVLSATVGRHAPPFVCQ
jgi:hypothetical protein